MPVHTIGLIAVWTLTFGIQEWSKGIIQYFLQCMKNANCVYDSYIDNTIVRLYHREVVFNPKLGPNIYTWLERLHFSMVSIL